MSQSDGHDLCQFERASKPLWVAWSMGTGATDVTLSGLGVNQVQVTEGVPTASRGEDVTDFATAFRVDIKAVTGGSVTGSVGKAPVFTEE